MNATQLLALFERISDAPDAVPRLRRFVLDLAVRGKLVPQNPKDEPASELLKRIAKEKVRMAKVGQKSPKPIPTLSEMPFGLPSNWQWSQIAEIGVLSPRNEAPDTTDTSFVPMPLIAAEYGVANEHEVRPWGEVKKGYTHFAEGDVGLAKITPCFENGKSTVFRNLTGGIGSGTTELHIVRPLFVDPDYVLLFLKSPYFIETGIPKMTGTAGQKRVPTDYFAHSAFPLPPLAEQRRIVARVGELMELCDRLEAARAERENRRDRLTASSLARLSALDPDSFLDDARFALDVLPALTTRPEQVKQLRQTILNLAVRGKLVPQDAADLPIAIAAQHLEEPTTQLPDSWRYVKLEALLRENTRNGYSRRPDDASDGVPILRISAGTVRRDGVVAEEEHKRISGIDAKTRGEYGLCRGDLLACRFNGNKAFVGRLTIFNDYLGLTPIYPDKLIRVRSDSRLAASAFLRLASEADLVRTEIEMYCATTVGNWGISASNLKDIRFPLPPIAEQRRIVAKVGELMMICDRLETYLQAGANVRSGLLAAIINEALQPAEERNEAA